MATHSEDNCSDSDCTCWQVPDENGNVPSKSQKSEKISSGSSSCESLRSYRYDFFMSESSSYSTSDRYQYLTDGDDQESVAIAGDAADITE